MVIRKIIGMLFGVLLMQGVIAQENTYDNVIGEAIARGDWFEARNLYESTADSLSDYMRLFSEALLDHNFNKPVGAVEKIQRIYDEYNAHMGSNVFSLFWTMSENLAKLGHFEVAYGICTSLLEQAREYMDEGTRIAYETNVVLFGLKSQWPKIQVTNTGVNYEIPFKIEDEQIKFSAESGNQRFGVMLDSASQITVIDRELAQQLELNISADSIQFNETRCSLTLLNTLHLGSAKFVNVVCAVLPLREVGVTDCSMILGNDMLCIFPEIELDYEHCRLHLRSQYDILPNTPRNLMFNKVPYIQAKIDGLPTTILWDTGSNKSSIEPHFYNAHRDQLPATSKHGRKRGKTATGKTSKLKYAILPHMNLTIGDLTGGMKDVYMIEDMPHAELMSVPFDATLGAVPPVEFKRLIINFKEMYFVVK
ncbi:MAG: aspartyl protease family protein [Tidjanibacter sp.]|nr:aspartyl protease family protein [Tidjanibacter sp.]